MAGEQDPRAPGLPGEAGPPWVLQGRQGPRLGELSMTSSLGWGRWLTSSPGPPSSAESVVPPSEEKGTFGGQRFVEKDPEMLTQRPESFPGCLTRVPWLLLLLLSSMGLCFVLLVTTLVQVSRVPGYPQEKFQDHQGNSSLVAAADQQMHPGLEQIRQQLAWINASLAGLCRPCPWSWEAFQESCYFFSRTLGSWEDSVSSCQAMGAHLVIINNTAEQRFLRYWDIRKSQRTWIGLSDHNNEGSWYWVDNTPLRLSFWKEGEPNDSGNEDCVELVAEDWNDSKCAAQNFWVCERPSAPCPGA